MLYGGLCGTIPPTPSGERDPTSLAITIEERLLLEERSAKFEKDITFGLGQGERWQQQVLRFPVQSGPSYSKPDPEDAWLIPGGGNAGHPESSVVPPLGPEIGDYIQVGPNIVLPELDLPPGGENSILDFIITRGAPLSDEALLQSSFPTLGGTPVSVVDDVFQPPVIPGPGAPDLNAPGLITPTNGEEAMSWHEPWIDLFTTFYQQPQDGGTTLVHDHDTGGGTDLTTTTQAQPMAGACKPPRYYVFDSVTRTFRPRRRQRRRKLATVGDIRDLAALQAVLGKGAAFTTWIATHSR